MTIEMYDTKEIDEKDGGEYRTGTREDEGDTNEDEDRGR